MYCRLTLHCSFWIGWLQDNCRKSSVLNGWNLHFYCYMAQNDQNISAVVLKLTQQMSKHTDSWWFHCTRTAGSATNEQLASQDNLFLSPKSKLLVVRVVQNMDVDPRVFTCSILDSRSRDKRNLRGPNDFLWQHFSVVFWSFWAPRHLCQR